MRYPSGLAVEYCTTQDALPLHFSELLYRRPSATTRITARGLVLSICELVIPLEMIKAISRGGQFGAFSKATAQAIPPPSASVLVPATLPPSSKPLVEIDRALLTSDSLGKAVSSINNFGVISGPGGNAHDSYFLFSKSVNLYTLLSLGNHSFDHLPLVHQRSDCRLNYFDNILFSYHYSGVTIIIGNLKFASYSNRLLPG